MPYVDGFLLPLPTKNIASYKRMARDASKIFMEHGALEYREWIGDDLKTKFGLPFTKSVKMKPGDTVVLAWIVYKNKAHRDRVNKKIMKDPRMKMPPTMPFDPKRMVYGGFSLLVAA